MRMSSLDEPCHFMRIFGTPWFTRVKSTVIRIGEVAFAGFDAFVRIEPRKLGLFGHRGEPREPHLYVTRSHDQFSPR